MAKTTTNREFLTTSEAQRLARTSPATLRRWASRHRLACKVGGRWRFDPDALARFLEGAPGTSRVA